MPNRRSTCKLKVDRHDLLAQSPDGSTNAKQLQNS